MQDRDHRNEDDIASAADGESTAPAWALSGAAAAERLEVDVARGLSAKEAHRRAVQRGPNRLRAAKRESGWRILVRQLESLIVLLLIAATVLSLAFGQGREAVAIVAVILINAAIGFVTELRAVRSMEALRQLGSVRARVRRDGAVKEVGAAALVPGDVVILEAGDLVPADLRLLEVSKLQVDESALTGESMPVGKAGEEIAAPTPLPERRNMLFRGTAVTRGSCEAIVVAIGMSTEIGRIANLVAEAKGEATPLERRLDRLGARLVWVTLLVTLVVTVSGVLSGRDLFLMVETGIALAIATVPEGLPIVATVALARGMWRMARRNALVNRLSAVETLGSTTVICSDKTGTLTENRMTVTCYGLDTGTVDVSETKTGGRSFAVNGQMVDVAADAVLRQALEVGALCSNAELPATGEEAVGEPMEVALLVAARGAGIERRELLAAAPEVREEAFLPDSKKMATFHQGDDRVRVAVKGAPEAVLAVCTRVASGAGERALSEAGREEWRSRNAAMAERGLRVLALATKNTESDAAQPYEDLLLVALVGLMDPPRADVGEAIAACRDAGIRVVMVTGDQAGTAIAVGRRLGLLGEDDATVINGRELKPPESLAGEERRRILAAPIFARVDPKQKLDLIAIHQQDGAIVAMTGDGVNDAPALKKADIGVAMGKRGTQVAAQAADMVLRDDAFSTIVVAIEQGRVIFENIRRFVLYLLSCNVSEVLVVAIATLVNLPLPIEPLQILFLNLVTDVFPALALGVGEGDPGVMRRPPRRPRAPILDREDWWAVAAYGLLITACVLAALQIASTQLGYGPRAATTLSFLTLAFAQLWHVFNMRARDSGLLRNDIVRNPWVWAALALCTGFLAAAVYLPALSRVLHTVPPEPSGWLLVAVLSAVPMAIGQVIKTFRGLEQRGRGAPTPPSIAPLEPVAGAGEAETPGDCRH